MRQSIWILGISWVVGTAVGISSGGVVERASVHYRVRLAVGPVAQPAHEDGNGHHGELGVIAQTVAQ